MKCGSIVVLAGLITLVSVSAAPAWDYFSVGVSYNAPVVYAPAVVAYEPPVVYAPVARTVVYDAPVVYDYPVYVRPRPFFNFTYIGGHGHRDYFHGRPYYYRGGGHGGGHGRGHR